MAGLVDHALTATPTRLRAQLAAASRRWWSRLRRVGRRQRADFSSARLRRRFADFSAAGPRSTPAPPASSLYLRAVAARRTPCCPGKFAHVGATSARFLADASTAAARAPSSAVTGPGWTWARVRARSAQHAGSCPYANDRRPQAATDWLEAATVRAAGRRRGRAAALPPAPTSSRSRRRTLTKAAVGPPGGGAAWSRFPPQPRLRTARRHDLLAALEQPIHLGGACRATEAARCARVAARRHEGVFDVDMASSTAECARARRADVFPEHAAPRR